MGLFDPSNEGEQRLGEFFEVDIKEKFKQAEKKFKTVFESSNDLIIFLDNKRNIIDINKRTLTTLGYKRSHFLNKKLKDLEIINNKDIDRIFKKNLNINEQEIILVDKKGNLLEVDFNNVIMKTEGKTVGRILVFRDVSDRKKLEELKFKRKQDKEIEEIRNQFFTLISHELRQPLVPILGYANVMIEEESSKTKKTYLKKILDNSNRLKELINKVLLVTALETGEAETSFKKVQIDKFVNSIIQPLENEVIKKKLKLVKNIKSVKAEIDEGMIKNVIENIIQSALKYTIKGKITISTQETNTHVLIKIEDTGKGMNKEEIKRLTKDIIKEKDFYTKMYKGLSLNYIINRLIVKVHKGEIKIESKSNKGTKVTIKLPKNQKK